MLMMSASMMQQSSCSGNSNSIREEMEDPSPRRGSMVAQKSFKDTMEQLSMIHSAEIQEVQLRMEHVQAENRLLRVKLRERGQASGGMRYQRAGKSVIRRDTLDSFENDDAENRFRSKSPADSEDETPKGDMQVPSERPRAGTAESVTSDDGQQVSHAPTTPASPTEVSAEQRKSRMRATRIVGQVDSEMDPRADSPKNNYLIRDIWIRNSMGKARPQQQAAAALQRSATSERLERRSSMTSEDANEMIGNVKEGIWKHLIGSPTSPRRMIWDALGGVMILWDIVALPLMVFQEVDGLFMDVLGMIGLMYWTMNVGNTLTSGYLQNGVLVMSPWLIFKRYLSRTIFLDLVTLVPDWVVTIVSVFSTGSDFQEARLLRALRAFRLTRLVRIVKLRWLMEVVRDYLDSEYASIMFEISKMMGLLLVINHVLACAWYGFSLVGIELGWNTWSADNVLNYGKDMEHQEYSWVYDYLTCLHWSLCQFTPASMEVQPANPLERGFAALTVLFALIVFSYIVGSITGSLTQLRMMSETITRETLKLRRFLRRNAVPIGLSLRIRRFVEFELKRRQQPVNQQSVGCLAVLSEQLQTELSFALVQPTLNTHGLFESLMKTSGGSLLLEKASQFFEKKTLAMDDWEFLPYTPATSMRFLLAGQLRYVRTFGFAVEENVDEAIIDPGRQWISEAVMWLNDWEYVGELSATIESHLLLISPRCILSLIDLYPASHRSLKNYANEFVMWIGGLTPEEMTDVLEPIIVTMLMKSLHRAKTEGKGLPAAPASQFPRATV